MLVPPTVDYGSTEQAIRPMVVTRKVWGGNCTAAGARAQSILLSILQTCRQQNRSPSLLLMQLLCSPQLQVLDLIPHFQFEIVEATLD